MLFEPAVKAWAGLENQEYSVMVWVGPRFHCVVRVILFVTPVVGLNVNAPDSVNEIDEFIETLTLTAMLAWVVSWAFRLDVSITATASTTIFKTLFTIFSYRNFCLNPGTFK